MDLRKVAAWVMLIVGISLSAAFGARNGLVHTSYRTANGDVELVCGEICKDGACQKACVSNNEAWSEERAKAEPSPDLLQRRRASLQAREGIGIPAPRPRLLGWAQVGGLGWLVGVVLIGGGALLARRVEAEEASGTGDASTAEVVHFPVVVAQTLERLGAIRDEIATLPYDDDAPAVREEIDLIFDELLAPAVESRGRFVAKHGIGGFAEYFGPFAAGERNLARCWSGLTDGHAEVARDALERSIESFEQALEAWNRID